MLKALLQMLAVASGHRSARPRRQDTGPLAFESLEARLLLEGNPILSVDFGAAGAEPGFVEQTAYIATHSTTAGDITVTVAGNPQGFYSYVGGGTNPALFDDFIFDNSGPFTMTLSGAGIAASTDYDLTFWCYYGVQARNTTITGVSGTTGTTLGPIAFDNPTTSLSDNSASGTFTSDSSGNLTFSLGDGRPAINGFEIASDGPDTTAPILLPGNIVDDQSGGPVNENTLVTYTLTFSEDIDESTVDASDFSNAGTAPISFGAITETTPGVFTVEVTPTAAGTLELQVPAKASILDTAGLSLDTASAIVDDTSINVVIVAPVDNTAPSPDPMSFATAPYASSDTSIAMVATAATDDSGVEYSFTETSGNPGGDNSGWQAGASYEDTGLTTGLIYTYTVAARDLSANQNATAPSDPASASATAQTSFVLSVDFGTAGVEPGFVAQTGYSQTHSTTAGDITVTVAGDPQGFYVYAGGGTNPALFDDFIFDNSGPFTMTLSGIGIAASTDYDLTFWSYYGVQARNTNIYAASGTTGTTLGPIAFDDPTTSLSDNSASGTFTSDSSGNLTFSLGDGRPAINGFAITPNGPDTRPPTLLPGNIIDDQNGGPVNENTLVTYTVAFSEDIDESTVDASDFGNAGTAPISFGTISETSPGMFTVGVTPTSAGTLQLQIPVGASIMDPAGNSLDTASAIVDDTTINVVVAPPDNIAPTPNPMTFATVPYASSETSIAMVATAATDDAGVEYYFTETSGNPGGGDSGWQASTTYEDTGLTTGLVYTYTVATRDLSANHNATAPSDPASATAQTPIVPPTITTPTTRHIVQRSATNVGAIEIEGTYSVGVPDRIEARAVVMTGSGNNGTTTAWQTIDAAPSGGSYSGTLTDVPAGGWYQLEVRCVIDGSPSNAAVLDKVGVGDIYVTAGQSNSANFAANQAPQDDRISARTSTTDSTWTLATAPLPISNGGWGSVWTWLGNKLIAAEDIPIGLVSLGVGGTTASTWTVGGGNYNSRLKPAVQSFPVGGFRAALWHQGESDSISGVSAATHSGYLDAMVSQSRIDAGWDIPWYLAEVSYHGSSNISAQEPIAAGQRMTISGDPLTFFGPSTDELHLTGGGSLHFNAVGTDAHAEGWSDILLGNVTVTPENGDFEDHGWLEYVAPNPTSPTPLADGDATIIDLVTTGLQLRVLDWRILTASGVNAADGSNGFYNPTTGTYAGAVDTVNGGVLPNMGGKHVAMLDGGAADNYFLQSTRVSASPDTIYTLTVALGVRDNPASFGDARLEITADGAVVASASFDKAAVDARHGSDASGTFTDVSVSWTTGSTVAANQPLAFRIVKEDGAGTVLDFDNVRFTAAAAPLNGDFDGDGKVDAGDYIALKRNIGTPSGATAAMGDADGDGDVDWNDLQILKSNYGSVAATPTPAIPMVSDHGIATDVETIPAPKTVLSSVMPAMTASIEADDIDGAMAAAALQAADPLRTLGQVRQPDEAALPLATPTPRRPQFNAMLDRIRRIQFPQEPACAAQAPQDVLMSSIAETPADIDADLMDILSLSKVLGLGSEGLNDVQSPIQRR